MTLLVSEARSGSDRPLVRSGLLRSEPVQRQQKTSQRPGKSSVCLVVSHVVELKYPVQTTQTEKLRQLATSSGMEDPDSFGVKKIQDWNLRGDLPRDRDADAAKIREHPESCRPCRRASGCARGNTCGKPQICGVGRSTCFKHVKTLGFRLSSTINSIAFRKACFFLHNKDYDFLACSSLPLTQLKNRRQTVEGTFFGVERPCFFLSGRGMEPGLAKHITRSRVNREEGDFTQKENRFSAKKATLATTHVLKTVTVPF